MSSAQVSSYLDENKLLRHFSESLDKIFRYSQLCCAEKSLLPNIVGFLVTSSVKMTLSVTKTIFMFADLQLPQGEQTRGVKTKLVLHPYSS